jgi:hypothetical protein
MIELLFALSLAVFMITFIWWGVRINKKEYLAHPRSARVVQSPTSDALSEHCCECMADKL